MKLLAATLAIAVILLAGISCARDSSGASYITPSSTEPFNIPATSSASPATSGDAPSAGIYFPVQKEPTEAHMDALRTGKLVSADGYLRVATDYSSKKALIIWPYGYTLSTCGNNIQVQDEKGQPRFRVGGQVRIGGGEIPADFVEEKIGGPLPEGLDGPFWLAAYTTRQPFIPTRLPDYQPQVSLDSKSYFQLIIENHMLRLKIPHGESLLAVWPYGYELRPEGQAYRIYDDKGQPVAWAGANNYYDGDVITLTGGEVSVQEAAESIGLPSVPDSWEGPFWLVSHSEDPAPISNSNSPPAGFDVAASWNEGYDNFNDFVAHSDMVAVGQVDSILAQNKVEIGRPRWGA